MHLATLLSSCLALALAVTSSPVGTTPKGDPPAAEGNSAIFKGLSMRILPLGASVTSGTGSTDKNGYRLNLWKLLVPPSSLNYVGSLKSGSMIHNANEGHAGFRIDQISGVAEKGLVDKPNVVLIHAGLNDVYQNYKLAEAPARLGSLIDKVHKSVPDAVILVANLFTNTNATYVQRIQTYNAALPLMISTKRNAGIKVLEADMWSALNKTDLYKDGEHPNDVGYKKMASVWYKALVVSAQRKWISKPEATGR